MPTNVIYCSHTFNILWNETGPLFSHTHKNSTTSPERKPFFFVQMLITSAKIGLTGSTTKINEKIITPATEKVN